MFYVRCRNGIFGSSCTRKKLEDTFKHKGLRKQLVATLKEKGITDRGILDAVGNIPRHFFIDSQFDTFAYKDTAFKIAAGQTISQPFTVAFQTTLLQVKKGCKVLEIGTGSGYQTCVLVELGCKVFTIERQRVLYLQAKSLLEKMKYAPKMFYGDGYKGLPSYAPFDRILVTCGASEIPQALVAQLAPGGRMVIPVGEGDVQKMVLLTKNEKEEIQLEEYGDFRFVPMLKNTDTRHS